jgi:hypothetical protein
MDDAEAAAVMKDALETAWIQNPEEVLAACDGSRLSFRAKECAGKPGAFDEYVSFLKERLWLKSQGGEVGVAKDAARGSSALGIRYWNPVDGGMVSFVRQRITWLNSAFAREKAELAKNISVDLLSANGVDLASNGEFVRYKAPSNPDDMDPSERALDLDPSRTTTDETVERVIERVGNPNAEEVPSGPDVAGNARSAALERLRRQPIDSDFFSSPNRTEFAFFSDVFDRAIEPAPAPEDRDVQLRSLAAELVDSYCLDMDGKEFVLQDIDEWDPRSSSFFRQFGEVTDFVIAKVASPNIAQGEVSASSEVVARLVGLTDSSDRSGSSLDRPSDPLTELHRAGVSIRTAQMWSEHATEEMLVSSDRPDYLFLTEALEEEAGADLHPEILSKELKRLATAWIQNNAFDLAFSSTLMDAVTKWDPLNEGYFNEMLLDHLQQIAIEQKQAALGQRTLQHQPVAVGPDIAPTDPFAAPSGPLTELNVEAFGRAPAQSAPKKRMAPADLLRSQPTLFSDEEAPERPPSLD